MAAGTATQATSTTAARLGNHPCRKAYVRNDDASIVVLAGYSASVMDWEILAGEDAEFEVRNTNQIFVKSASGTPTVQYRWE